MTNDENILAEVSTTAPPDFPAVALWLMTVATGLCVASLYYCQPLQSQMQISFAVSEQTIGWIPTLTQVGYALGMLLLVPLGDLLERRALIVAATLLSALAVFGLAFSTRIETAMLMSFLVGLSTMTPQFIVPFAAQLAPPAKRGQIVGTVMSGLLLGILLARTVAGFIGSAWGWRAMFILAGGVVLLLAILLYRVLPRSESSFKGSYLGLIGSVWGFVRTQPVLRESMIFGGCLFAAFSAFWVTLIHLLESESFQLGARSAGLFGLLGAVGALGAPLIGRLADKGDPRRTIGFGIVATGLCFLIYGVWGESSLIALAIGVVLMDVGIQGAHVTNQSRVFALVPEARSRLNTAYMFAYFTGGAAGSYGASWAWAHYRWPGVCAVALSFIMISALVYLRPFVTRRSVDEPKTST